MTKTVSQRVNLLALARNISKRNEPLGVGLKNQCWAGVAIARAKQKGQVATDCYGLTMGQIKSDIMFNNRTAVEDRNRAMVRRTIRHALT